MPKEQQSAQQLASKVKKRLGREALFIWVSKHPENGWHGTVVAAPHEAFSLQPIVDEIVRELRLEYELKE